MPERLPPAIAFVGLSFVDNAQARALNGVERFETAVYGTIADADAQNDDIKGIFDNAVSTVFNNCLNKKLITPNGVEFVVMNEFAIPGDNDQSETEKMISVRDYLAGEAEQTALNAASVAVDRDFFCAIENYYPPWMLTTRTTDPFSLPDCIWSFMFRQDRHMPRI